MTKEEKLQEAKRLYKTANADQRYVLESLFPELAGSKDERMRNEIIKLVKFYYGSSLALEHTVSKDEMVSWLEKQGEQKSIFDFNANNWYVSKVDGKIHNLYNSGVEPKFHEGDWVVWQDKCYKVNYNGCRYELIDQNGLSTSLEHGTVDGSAHLWNISDAKDGDVLAFNNNTIVIFKDLYNSSTFHSYCHIEDGVFDISEDNMPDWWEGKGFHPATKEQRDLLFQKMKEAGYEWDTEKKELKKIEEEYNGEDYGIDSLFHAQRILEKTLGKVDGYQTDDGILSHKCAITAVKKLYEQKSAWSEEDENILNECIDAVDQCEWYPFNRRKKMKNWLKQIKQRMEK